MYEDEKEFHNTHYILSNLMYTGFGLYYHNNKNNVGIKALSDKWGRHNYHYERSNMSKELLDEVGILMDEAILKEVK